MYLIKRRLPIDEEKIKFKLEESTLEIELSEETFLSEGLQVIKRAIANDIFKFVPLMNNVKFIESYKQSTPLQSQQQSKSEEKPVNSTIENKSA
jgi:peptidylprolyl isomerase